MKTISDMKNRNNDKSVVQVNIPYMESIQITMNMYKQNVVWTIILLYIFYSFIMHYLIFNYLCFFFFFWFFIYATSTFNMRFWNICSIFPFLKVFLNRLKLNRLSIGITNELNAHVKSI